MHKFVKTLRSEFRSPVPLIGWVFLSGIAGLSGPFGSYGLVELSRRVVFWCLALGLAVSVLVVLRSWIVSRDWQLETRRVCVISAVLATVTVAPPLYLLHQIVLTRAGHPMLDAVEFGLFLLFCMMSVGAGRVYCPLAPVNPVLPPDLRQPQALQPAPSSPMPAPVPPPTFTLPDAELPFPRVVQRLDPDQRGRLISLSVRNHHVDVITARGQGSVLLRFSDALAETAPEEGTQVHRSHWVAWWAIEAAEPVQGKLWLRLTGGGRLPVSKTHRAKLELRGLV